MNIEKRRKVKIVHKDEVRTHMMKPLLDVKHPLLPEYITEQDAHMFELTLKKRSDQDKIPVHVSLFGRLNNICIFFLNETFYSTLKVYQNSKLHFFKFVLVLAEHLDPTAYKICYMGKQRLKVNPNL